MIVTQVFERATFRVKAIRVTTSNMAEIAEWSGGRVVIDETRVGRSHIAIPTGPKVKRQSISHAYVGNWVTCLEKSMSFRVYKEQSFQQAFRQVMTEAEKFAWIHEKLIKIARNQDIATFNGESSEGVMLLIDKTAREICSII